MIEQGEPKTSAAGDDEVHDRPGHRQTGGLTQEPADDLGSPPNLLERALQQVGRAQPLLEPERIGQVNGQGRQVVGQARRGRWSRQLG